MVSKKDYVRIIILLTAGVLALFAFFIDFDRESEAPKTITSISIGESNFKVLLADTPALRQQGLSGRESLEKDQGMLFLFEDSSVRHFWMKDMNFPLDIIWITEDLLVAGISKNVPVESYPETVSSDVPVRYVFEINALESDERGIKTGDSVFFNRE